MTLPSKGTRRITVDAVRYRWAVRRKPTYSQGIGLSPLTVAVEHDEPSGSVLVVRFSQAHPGNWLGSPSEGVTPGDVAFAIREARGRGWQPETPAGPFRLHFPRPTGLASGTPTDDGPAAEHRG